MNKETCDAILDRLMNGDYDENVPAVNKPPKNGDINHVTKKGPTKPPLPHNKKGTKLVFIDQYCKKKFPKQACIVDIMPLPQKTRRGFARIKVCVYESINNQKKELLSTAYGYEFERRDNPEETFYMVPL